MKREGRVPEEEWNFDKVLTNFPDWAERWCREWEFTRTLYKENRKFQLAVTNWRKGKVANNGFYEDPFDAALLLGEEIACRFRVVCFASWPREPFSSMAKIQWDHLEWGESTESQGFTPSLCDIDKLPSGGEVVLGPEGKSVLTMGEDVTWLAIKVEWAYQTDKEVVAGLEKWLKAARDPLGKQPLPREYNNESRRLRKELKALGGYRLSLNFERQFQVVANYGNQFPDVKSVSLAIKEATRVLEGLF